MTTRDVSVYDAYVFLAVGGWADIAIDTIIGPVGSDGWTLVVDIQLTTLD